MIETQTNMTKGLPIDTSSSHVQVKDEIHSGAEATERTALLRSSANPSLVSKQKTIKPPPPTTTTAGGEADELQLNHPQAQTATPLLAFFSLGAASDISWNAIYMSVAYFESLEGKSVISHLGLAQNLPWLAVMVLMLMWPSATDNVRSAFLTISLTHVYMLALCVLFPVLVFENLEVPSIALYVLVALNGITTGLSQSYVAACAGMFSRYSLTRGATSYQLMGAAFGISVPTLIQLFLIPKMRQANTDTQSYDITLFSIKIVFPCAAGILLCSLVSLWYLWRHRVTRAARIKGMRECRSECCNEPEPQLTKNLKLTLLRSRQLIGAFLGEVIVAAIMSYTCAATPFIKPVRPTAFWSRNLDTVCLIAFSISGFIGRAIPEQAAKIGCFSRVLSSGMTMVLLITTQFIFLAGVIAYFDHENEWFHFITSWDFDNAIIIAWYGLGSMFSGVSIVSLSRYAQEQCRHSHVLPCVITSQLVWISIQFGSVVGIGLSFFNS
eukprot:m.185753 g.185753  ORF g.185753 m.185753 type:complete len:497 (+) comp16688_c1_seq13:530-2020(+)